MILGYPKNVKETEAMVALDQNSGRIVREQAVRASVDAAIRAMGVDAFKRTSFFPQHRACEILEKVAA